MQVVGWNPQCLSKENCNDLRDFNQKMRRLALINYSLSFT